MLSLNQCVVRIAGLIAATAFLLVGDPASAHNPASSQMRTNGNLQFTASAALDSPTHEGYYFWDEYVYYTSGSAHKIALKNLDLLNPQSLTYNWEFEIYDDGGTQRKRESPGTGTTWSAMAGDELDVPAGLSPYFTGLDIAEGTYHTTASTLATSGSIGAGADHEHTWDFVWF